MGRSMKLLFILFAILVFFNCAPKSETYTVEIIDGVRHVHNLVPKWGEEQRIELEFFRRIGELETQDTNYQFYRPRDIALDSKDNMYINDSGNYRILKYDKNGIFLLSFGNKGQGPGEFSQLSRIVVFSDYEIYVAESGNFGPVHVFSNKGELIREFNRNRYGVLFEAMNSKGHYVLYHRNINDTVLVHLMKGDNTEIRGFGQRIMYENLRMRLMGNSYDCVIDSEDNFYLVFSQQNRLEKYTSDGELLWRSSRLLPYEESKEFYWVNPDAITTNQFSSGVQLDQQGRIWVTTYKTQVINERKNPGSKVFEIFDNNGVLLTRLENEKLYSIARFKIYGDRLYIIDSLYEHAVFEYRIIDKK
ncbi:6-bladed beta-propeller [candidate division KSB1 bacterium]